eukprot:3853095-Rhodomonas_salina.1
MAAMRLFMVVMRLFMVIMRPFMAATRPFLAITHPPRAVHPRFGGGGFGGVLGGAEADLAALRRIWRR